MNDSALKQIAVHDMDMQLWKRVKAGAAKHGMKISTYVQFLLKEALKTNG